MELIQKVKKTEQYVTELNAKATLLNSQIQRLLADCGYSSEKEALQDYENLKEKLPEYEQKLDAYLLKIKNLLEED